jgi:hypothetical protein
LRAAAGLRALATTVAAADLRAFAPAFAGFVAFFSSAMSILMIGPRVVTFRQH